MRENTPPHRPDFEYADEEILEEIDLDGEPPIDDDELEMEEVMLEQLQARLAMDDDEDEEEDRERIANIKDEAVFTFRKHTAPIFGCHLHPRLNWAVTGSEDDRAYVWDINNGEVLFTIAEHKDTVTETHFNHDGHYLATGDISGELFVFKVNEQDNEGPSFNKVWEYSMCDMAWMFWHPAANILLAGGETGEVYIWRIPSGECKILPGHSARCETGKLSGDGKKLLTAYANGIIKLWDLKTCQVLMEVNEQHPLSFGEISHIVVDCEPNSPFYLCAEGTGKLLFCTNNGPVNVVQFDHGIECVAFAPSSADLKLVACGSLDGQITVWDYSKNARRTTCENPVPNDGILCLKWVNDNTFLTTTAQGNLNAFDARTGALKFTLTGHLYHVYECDYKREENYLLTVSEDNTAKIFKLPPLDE